MKSINEAELRERFAELLDEALRQPIVIRREGQDIAAMVSMASYERLRAADVQAFLDLRIDIAGEAGANGLSEDELSGLLRDDS